MSRGCRNRLGLVKGTDAVKMEQELMKLVPQKDWTLFSHWLIWHGRRRCDARKPDCANCEIKKLCPQIGVKTDNKVTQGTKISSLPKLRVLVLLCCS